MQQCIKGTTQEKQTRWFDFTRHFNQDDSNAYDEAFDHIKSLTNIGYGNFQLELGEKTNRKHFQGRIQLYKKNRLSFLVKNYKGFWWSITATNSICEGKDAFEYVTKEHTRLDGPWIIDADIKNPKKLKFIPDHYIVEKWLPWQQQLQNMMFQYDDDRAINMLIDHDGGLGKSTIVGFLCCQLLAILLPYCNDFKEMNGMLCSYFRKSKKGTKVKKAAFDKTKTQTIFIDLPRAIKKDKLAGLFAAIESIKNGYTFDPRYEMKSIYFQSPHVWVFSNKIPDLTYLSKDKWRFWKVINNVLVRVGIETIPQSVILPKVNLPAFEEPNFPDTYEYESVILDGITEIPIEEYALSKEKVCGVNIYPE